MRSTARRVAVAAVCAGCGAGFHKPPPVWLGEQASLEAASGALAQVLSHGPTARPPWPEEIRDVTAPASLQLVRVLGQYGIFHPGVTSFTGHGKFLVSADASGDLRVWDPVRRLLTAAYPSCTQEPHGLSKLALSPDGSMVALGTRGGRICVREMATGRIVRSWSAHKATIQALAFTPSGELLSYAYNPEIVVEAKLRSMRVSEEAGGELHRWRLGSEAPVATARIGGLGGVRIDDAIRLSNDGNLIAVQRRDARLQGLDTSGRVLWTAEHAHAQAFAFIANDRELLVVESQSIYVLDALTGRRLRDFKATSPVRKLFWEPGKTDPWASCLAISPDGRRAMTALRDDAFVFVWDVRSGRELEHPVARDFPVCRGGRYAPDGTLLVAPEHGGQLALWDPVLRLPLPDRSIQAVSLSADGRWAATCGADYVVRLWNLDGAASVRQWRTDSAIAAALSAKGDRMLVSFGRDWGSARVIDTAAGGTIWSQADLTAGHPSAFSPDGRYAATSSHGKGIVVHDLARDRTLWTQPAHDYQDAVIAFSPDGRLFIHQDRDHILSIRAVEDGHLVRRLGEPQNLWDVSWSPDGKYVVAHAAGLLAYQVETGRLIRQYPYPGDRFALAADGVIMRALEPERTVARFERLADGVELGSIALGDRFRQITSLATTSDGRRVLIGTGSGVVLVFAGKGQDRGPTRDAASGRDLPSI